MTRQTALVALMALVICVLILTMWQPTAVSAGFTPTPRPPDTPVPQPTAQPQPPPEKEPKDVPAPTPKINLTATPAELPPGGGANQRVYGGLALVLWCTALAMAGAAAKRISR